MKKRIFSLLLLLGTVLSLFPVQTVMAEEILPKDETPGAAETIEEEELPQTSPKEGFRYQRVYNKETKRIVWKQVESTHRK